MPCGNCRRCHLPAQGFVTRCSPLVAVGRCQWPPVPPEPMGGGLGPCPAWGAAGGEAWGSLRARWRGQEEGTAGHGDRQSHERAIPKFPLGWRSSARCCPNPGASRGRCQRGHGDWAVPGRHGNVPKCHRRGHSGGGRAHTCGAPAPTLPPLGFCGSTRGTSSLNERGSVQMGCWEGVF